jgi:uncharacterized protein YqeY
MKLLEKIQQDLIAAMKAKAGVRLGAVRMIKTALKKYEVDSGKPLDEAAENKVLNTLRKQRLDAIEMYRKGGRPELAEKEEAELKLVESYMPAPANDEEMEAAVEAAIKETGADSLKQMGAVMKLSQAKLAGKRVDGKTLSGKVRARLS